MYRLFEIATNLNEAKMSTMNVAIAHRSPRSLAAGRPLAVVTNWYNRFRQRVHLAELDAHMRRDIGLSEHDIAIEIAKPFWR